MYVWILNKVISCPPCIELVEVKAIPGLFSKAFVDQMSPVESKKYLRGAAMDPKRVGDPIARPSQLIKSSLVQYISPESGILESILSLFVEIFGTVLSFTFKFCSSAPSAIAWARFLTDPDAE